ncbi:MAG: hypothetical protein HY291_12320 [Planctomycetes bacterium]|nr:hypothetical protein [Planctomycetota bacterium]
MERKVVLIVGEACDRFGRVTTTLATCGYKVEKARDVLEAIEKLNAGVRVDLILMHTPEDALRFREAHEFLRTSGYAAVPTILLSNSDYAEEIHACSNRYRTLGDPESVDWFELIRTTQELIGSAQPHEVWLD